MPEDHRSSPGRSIQDHHADWKPQPSLPTGWSDTLAEAQLLELIKPGEA